MSLLIKVNLAAGTSEKHASSVDVRGEHPGWLTVKRKACAAAREKILSGATQLADAVRVTLGPKSKSVLMQNKWGNPTVCNDGVTIAKRDDLRTPRRTSVRKCRARPRNARVTRSATGPARQRCWST